MTNRRGSREKIISQLILSFIFSPQVNWGFAVKVVKAVQGLVGLLLPLDDRPRVLKAILISSYFVLYRAVPGRKAAKVDVNGVWKINNSLILTFMNITWLKILMKIILGPNFLICINVNMEPFGKLVLYSSDVFPTKCIYLHFSVVYSSFSSLPFCIPQTRRFPAQRQIDLAFC